jgi:YbbR domain-containing protein
LSALLAFLGRNKSLKLLSLFLAIALWLAVGGEERTETNLNISLELLNLPSNLMVTSEVPANIQVRISGPRGLIRTLVQGRLTHTLDLAGAKPGRQSFPLGSSTFDFPRGVQVTRVQPNPLVLTFTPAITRTLPIEPVLLGHPPEGLQVKGVKIRPPSVKVKGPASELDQLQAIPTVPLEIAALASSTTLSADLNFTDLHVSVVRHVPILADIEIGPKPLQRTFQNVPVVPQPQPAKLSAANVTFTVRGPWLQVKNLQEKSLTPYVTTAGLSPGRHQLKVQVQLPEGLTLENISPPVITARVEK